MADDDPHDGELERLRERIDLLLDDEAGADGARWLAEMDEDPAAKAEFDFARSVDLALRNALEEEEPPASLWASLEAGLEAEPPPALGWVDWIQVSVRSLLQPSHRRTALAGSSFLFLLTCGTLWWDGSGAYMPPPRRELSWQSPSLTLERRLSDQLDREAERALEDMIYENNYLRSLEGVETAAPLDAPEGGAP